MQPKHRAPQILVIFLVFFALLILFFAGAFFRVSHQRTPNLTAQKIDIPLRGEIKSADGFLLAQSEKIYKVTVDTRALNPKKRDFFVQLFSIYTGISPEIIKKRLQKNGFSVLSYSIDALHAESLKRLNAKFLSENVFTDFSHNGIIYAKTGLFIEVSGVRRIYPHKDALEPILGYVQKFEDGALTLSSGVKGVEKAQNFMLLAKNRGEIRGRKDVSGNVIFDRTLFSREKIDGENIFLSTNLLLQRGTERILDAFNEKYQSDEILAAVLDPKTGEILTLATTRRFIPKNIKNHAALNSSAIEKPFEPGSTIKPLVFALLLEKNLINPLGAINLQNGTIKIGQNTFKDDAPPKKNATIQDVLIHSSNVGMIKLSRHLSGQELFDGLSNFGLGEISGVDLPYEKTGVLPNPVKLSSAIYKASASFGYGMTATFMQILRAYGAFVNDGKISTPHLVTKRVSKNGEHIMQNTEFQAIDPLAAKKISQILIKVVQQGTGQRARVDGVEIGGKTGTARVTNPRGGYFDDMYNSSFFGFARGKNAVYVIGVVSFGIRATNGYYGSQSAAPIFREIVRLMREQGVLK